MAPVPKSSCRSPGANSSRTEVERAIDNLMKSGKLFGPRRDMGVGRQYSDFGTTILGRTINAMTDSFSPDPRMGGGSRHPSMDFDPMRSHSGSNLQNYYASARYQPRSSDADQMQQAKRRMAAQRERELRNYHQEQQYSRSRSPSDPSFYWDTSAR